VDPRGLALVLVLVLHLLPAMLAGMLVYELVHLLAPTVSTRFSDQRRGSLRCSCCRARRRGDHARSRRRHRVLQERRRQPSALLTKMAEIVASSQRLLPQWLVEQLPQDPTTSAIAGRVVPRPRRGDAARWARKRDAPSPTCSSA
jgi:hypothetical protein